MESAKPILCPRCKIPMTLNIESTVTRETVRVSYSYRCKNCGYRIDDAMLLAKRKGNQLELVATKLKK